MAFGNRSNPAAKPEMQHFRVFVAFVVVAFVIGGGARPDLASLPILRPLAFVGIGYALICGAWERTAEIRAIVWLAVALAAIIALQLVPLPPSVWKALPGREAITAIGTQIGADDVWRSLSLTPGRTFNSLMSLSVPLAAVLLFVLLTPRRRGQAFAVFIALGALTTLVGVAQEVTGTQSALFFYDITNRGSAVGLFANRNHQAFFLASLLPLIIFGLSARDADDSARFPWALKLASLLLIILMLPIVGSRGGLLIGLIAVLASVPIYLALHPLRGNVAGQDATDQRRKVIGVVGAMLLTPLLLLAPIVFGRASALNRLFDDRAGDETRIEMLPYILDMTFEHLPFGTGFGSFEKVFYAFEPDSFLAEPYMNQAHNDWVQLLSEAGIFGAAVLLAFMITGARAFSNAWQQRGRQPQSFAFRLSALVSLVLIGIASIVDYPLRVPSLMVFFSLLACVLIAPTGWIDLNLSPQRAKRRHLSSPGPGTPTFQKSNAQ